MSAAWQWFLIGLVVSGFGTGIICAVILMYLFAAYANVSYFITDKFAVARFIRRKFAFNPFGSLGL